MFCRYTSAAMPAMRGKTSGLDGMHGFKYQDLGEHLLRSAAKGKEPRMHRQMQVGRHGGVVQQKAPDSNDSSRENRS